MGVSTNLGFKDVIELIRQSLCPIEFEVIRLKILDELPYADIAELFGTTPEAVRKRHVRALLKVRKSVADPFASSGSMRR